jgi:hypothetical protein
MAYAFEIFQDNKIGERDVIKQFLRGLTRNFDR